MDGLINIQFDIESILDKDSCASLENLALLSNKKLADNIQVNGTKAYFQNVDGIDVDLTPTALLIAGLNQDLIQM